MKFENIKEWPVEKFRRLTGVKRETFNRMLKILEESIKTRATQREKKRS